MDACVITLDDKSNRNWIFAPLLHLISSWHRSQRSTFKLSVALSHNIDTHILYQSVSLTKWPEEAGRWQACPSTAHAESRRAQCSGLNSSPAGAFIVYGRWKADMPKHLNRSSTMAFCAGYLIAVRVNGKLYGLFSHQLRLTFTAPHHYLICPRVNLEATNIR